MKRIVKRFAFFPVKLSSGKWIWLKYYSVCEELKSVYGIIEDYGWPDPGTWGWEEKWITTQKECI